MHKETWQMGLDKRVIMGHQFPRRNTAFKKVDGPRKMAKTHNLVHFLIMLFWVFEPFHPHITNAWTEPYMSNHSV